MGKVNNDDIKCDETPQTKVGTICGCNCIRDTSQDAADHEAVFLKTEIQNCIIHQMRNFSKDVSYKNLKALMADLKAVYAADSLFKMLYLATMGVTKNGQDAGRIGAIFMHKLQFC